MIQAFAMQRILPLILAVFSSLPLTAQISFDAQWRSLGPANMSGRIVDLAVDPQSPSTWYVATASGGLFKTATAGTTWKPVFEKANTISLGAVAIAPSDPNTVWVGTGESNPRNSVSWGDGVYVSRDAGETWDHAGLEKTFQIGAIAIHPEDPDTVFVAACGRLWGTNKERGLYRTTDGGKKWKQVVKVDSKTGAIDVLIDPTNPKLVYAATYERQRDQFDSNDPVKRWGKGSGIWRSTDGGAQWQKATRGLPSVAIGRIGLTLSQSNPEILYAVIETERSGWATGDEKAPLDDKDKPHKGYSTRLGGQVPNIQDKQGLNGFETGGIFCSKDHGVNWERVNSLTPRPFYFSQIRVDPKEPNGLCVLGIQYYLSADGGAKFEQVTKHGIHVDFHALWIDPNNTRHWLVGSDGGLHETWDRGQHYRFFDNLPCSQFYHVAVDNRDPYHVYGGLQDNGSWGFPTRSLHQDGLVTGDVYKFGMGDGFRVVPHPTTEGLVYYTSQNGGVGWRNVLTGTGGRVKKPKAPEGSSLRFNWDTPFLLSPHKPDTLWMAGNYVLRIEKDPKDSKVMSPILGRTKRGTASTFSISKKSKGLMYVGTDDGAIWVSRNTGKTWKNISSSLQSISGRYISSLQASQHTTNTVYMAIDGHRSDDMRVHTMVSRNNGRSWSRIGKGITQGPVRVLREDPVNPDLLYAGTEFGIFVSLDKGRSWLSLQGNLPSVPVHDMAIQEREKELVIATHGRGIWTLDISGLQGCPQKVQKKAVDLIQPKPISVYRKLPVRYPWGGHAIFKVPNPPAMAVIHYWLKSKVSDALTVEILNGKSKVVRKLEVKNSKGLHRVTCPPPSGKGPFTVRLQTGKATITKKLEIVSK
jgi:photosystem II stability/assembly factor-like uncharacterized protein